MKKDFSFKSSSVSVQVRRNTHTKPVFIMQNSAEPKVKKCIRMWTTEPRHEKTCLRGFATR